MNQEQNVDKQMGVSKTSQELFHKPVTSGDAFWDPLLSQQIIKEYPDRITLLDYAGKLLYTNDSGRRSMGIDDFASYQFTEWTALWSEEGRSFAEKALDSARMGHRATFDAEFLNAKGTQQWWEVTVIPLVDTQGQISHMLTLSRDSTPRKREQVVIKELEQQREDFLSIAAHELKTPLTALQGNIQLAQRRLQNVLGEEEVLHPTQHLLLTQAMEILTRSLKNAKTQNRLINDLLDISRVQAGKLEFQLSPSNLVALVQETIQDQQSAFPQRVILLNPSDTAPSMVLVDPGRIKQVISNYITNALKYSSMEQPVQVGVSSEGAYARVWVQDRGIGLSQKQQELIWERFYQTQEITVSAIGSPGLGLGLYICQALIHGQGGEVGVESTQGVGSTFWFTLPTL